MRLLMEGTVMGMAAIGFCLILVAFGMMMQRGGWARAHASAAEGRWPLPRRLLLAGATLGALAGLLMIVLGLSQRGS